MSIKIALAGNPNCGKTTLFNELTGSNQYVGNWPGVTVEKKDGLLRNSSDVILQDLPGIYSLSPYSQEEVVTRRYLVEDKPDAIINIIDGTNIERNLYLTTQLLELNLPMVVAVNMMDVVEKKGDKMDLAALGQRLGCEVMAISAMNGSGCQEVAERAIVIAHEHKLGERPHVFSGSVEHALAHIEESIQSKVAEEQLRWYAVKVFERDEKILQEMDFSAELMAHIEAHIADCEKEMDDESDSIITNQRYSYIGRLVEKTVQRHSPPGTLTTSDKIDKIVTNRILALPLFALVIWLMYYIAVTTVGTWATDWANDGVFGDGWFLPFTCQTEEWDAATSAYDDARIRIEAFEAAYQKAGGAGTEEAAVSDEATAQNITAEAVFEDEESGEITATETVNYQSYLEALKIPEPRPEKYGIWVPGVPALAEELLIKLNAGPMAHSIIQDALIGGVGTVLGFLPQILIVFLFLSFLEDCGYMSRVAFIMDRIFRRFGLSGKSFIPMLVGLGCGVPAVMAARTIENQQDRRMTILLSTFIPCGAKVAIIALICSAFFRDSIWVAPSMYFIAIGIIVLGGIA
ncbi:MAG: ferrous iron transporter B, partial [Victivallales bacterium]|nr:ferrous iron transporter B [Victivallales bacterium]